MATVKFENASRIYPGTNRAAVDRLNLDVKDGEFLVLVGPSGCGKSTSLRMLAGLEDINEGSIYIGDKDVSELPPKQRDIAMVFQNYALYPQMTVAENMGFALKIAKAPKSEIETRVKEAARMLDLDQYLERYPRALSGGQRQRVAMGRAIVREPQVFLMDEPLSNLDAKLRVSTRAEIAALQRRLGITTFYVTHDQVEAMTMGDRVAVLKDGLLQQVAVPLELYDRPANRFVATFIGSPQMNIMRATVTDGRTRRRRAAHRAAAGVGSCRRRARDRRPRRASRAHPGRWPGQRGTSRRRRHRRGARIGGVHLRPRHHRRAGTAPRHPLDGEEAGAARRTDSHHVRSQGPAPVRGRLRRSAGQRDPAAGGRSHGSSALQRDRIGDRPSDLLAPDSHRLSGSDGAATRP